MGPEVLHYLYVDKVTDERHEDHVVSIPSLSGIHLDPPLQLPPLTAVPHENLRETVSRQWRQNKVKTFVSYIFVRIFVFQQLRLKKACKCLTFT